MILRLSFRGRFVQALRSGSEKTSPLCNTKLEWLSTASPTRSNNRGPSWSSQYPPKHRTSARFFSQSRSQRPAGVRLAASILDNPPNLLLSSLSDLNRQNELNDSIFKQLDIPHPAQLPDTYDDAFSYHRSLASLVVEETRYSIAKALHGMPFFQSSIHQTNNRTACVRASVTGDRSDNPFIECYTHEPLSRMNRDNLRTGAVIVIFRDGSDYSQDDMLYGVIQYSSMQTRPCTFVYFVRIWYARRFRFASSDLTVGGRVTVRVCVFFFCSAKGCAESSPK